MYNGLPVEEFVSPLYGANLETPTGYVIYDNQELQKINPDDFVDWNNTPMAWPGHFDIKFPCRSRPSPYEEVYVRCTSQSNIWDINGNKINAIDIIPIVSNYCDMVATRTHTETRVYNIKDSLNSMRQF